MKRFLRELGAAFGFLTVIPVPAIGDWDERDLGRSALFFPLVGLVIGGCAGWGGRLLSRVFPMSVASVLTLILWIFLSGGLHWDGLADCCDGFFYAGSTERRREIMKDSRVGTFASLGLFLSLLLKWSLISSVSPAEMPFCFAFCAALSRWSVLLLIPLPLVSSYGAAAWLKKGYRYWTPMVAWIFFAPLLFFVGLRGGIAVVTAVCCAWVIRSLAKGKIGGLSGDVMGLCIEVTEILALLCLGVL